MAGSRLERIGTIFSRTYGLIKTGAVPYKDRPIWFDIYRVFPPKYEPICDRVSEITDEVPNLFYKEDTFRAAFYKKFGPNPRINVESTKSSSSRDLFNYDQLDPSDKFIEICNDCEKSHNDWSLDQVINEALDVISPSIIRQRFPTEGELGEEKRRLRRGRTTTSTGEKRDNYYFKEDIIEEHSRSTYDLQDEQMYTTNASDFNRHRDELKKKKLNIITEDTLRSLFEKAKEDDVDNGNDGGKKK